MHQKFSSVKVSKQTSKLKNVILFINSMINIFVRYNEEFVKSVVP